MTEYFIFQKYIKTTSNPKLKKFLRAHKKMIFGKFTKNEKKKFN